MIGFYDYTVILTYISVAISLVGMALAFREYYFCAIVCLLFSGLCDMFDGMIARTKKNRTVEEKKNGIQLDSLADIVCFGVFPAVIGIVLAKDTVFFPVMVIISVLYVLCGIIRLAYFNVTEELRQQKTNDRRKNYDGLPITSIALIVPALFCARAFMGMAFPVAYMIVLFLVALCFILKFRIKKLGTMGNIVLICLGILIFACLVGFQFAS